MRPSGRLHLGHWFGALSNWVALQDQYECYWMVADWHALMSEYRNPARIRQLSLENVADWIACGLDPDRSVIFLQSDVPEHAELHMILSSYTPISWLERVPTYKEQVEQLKAKDVTNYAFLGYPVLQAADIALYKAKVVPVGEDQLAHLELTREIIRRFNSIVGREILVEPAPRLTRTPRLMGIDGTRKMSRSYGNALDFADDADTLRKKAMSMFTDPGRQRRADPGRPEVCNVFTFHGLFNDPSRVEEIRKQCSSAGIGCVECKQENAARLEQFVGPIREKRRKLLENPATLREILIRGAARAREVARRTMDEIREAIFGERA